MTIPGTKVLRLARLLVASCAIVLCFLVVGSDQALAQVRSAKIEAVTASDADITRVFFGRVAARQTVDLAFQVGGQILELPIDEGDEIIEGDLIGRLDLEPFELDLAQRRAELDQAVRDFERFRQLLGSAVSQVDVDDAETEAQLAEIAVRNSERSLRLATLKAPFDGIVASRTVPNFTTVSAGSPVARLHDMSDLRIEIEVPEILFQQAGADPDVELFAEFPSSENLYELEFREVTAETTSVGQTFKITLGMAPPDDLFVLPGSSALVYATLQESGQRITVPSTALIFDNDNTAHVMVFESSQGDEGSAVKTAVTIGATNSGEVEVLTGLEPGTEIIVSGASLIEDGETVRRFGGFD
ncbi:MAG: efflux RND transporter periplasmic adaptor subunit [Pseudomonadota bacterium]